MKYRERIERCISEQAGAFEDIALAIHARPEVSNHEFFACQTLSDKLAEQGFDVRVDVAGHRTGFDARYRSGKPGPTVAFLAEYDALPGIGHACGHNLFGAISALAGCALKHIVDDLGGEVRVYGTPGEEGGENGSAKESFVREGFFKDVDFALCAHPSDRHLLTTTTLANNCVKIEFTGRPAHAAASPEKGINALDAVLFVFNAINAMRQHVTDDCRIHGIITHGGDAPNIVPEFAACYFFLRAAKKPTAQDLYDKMERIVEGASLATGAAGRMYLSQNRVDNTLLTPSLDAVYRKNLESCGEQLTPVTGGGMGSSDVGNVSHAVPTIQPSLRISDGPLTAHSEGFREAAKARRALDAIPLGAKVLALTAMDLFLDPDLLQRIQAEHARALAEELEG
ncbi:MAG: M20 family metallopeptidase [Clostridiales bacterium]|nr:M20 family metallopeptidase [Clostridiales bacterium]